MRYIVCLAFVSLAAAGQAESPARVRPNIVLVIADDCTYSDLEVYGGQAKTPNLSRLAAQGMRFTHCFQAAPMCSPTRACLLTGRNHHAVGMRGVSNMDTGFPNMRGYLPRSAATLPELLREQGYATFATGKWHLTPPTESTTAGPFHRWPLGRGFERFYGFMPGSTDHWYPDLVHDNHPVPAPSTPEEGYHLNIDLADRAIGFIKDAHVHAPDKPFFAYIAHNAVHAPLQSKPEDRAKYRGVYDAGWTAVRRQRFERQLATGLVPAGTRLPASDPRVPRWEDTDPANRDLLARRLGRQGYETTCVESGEACLELLAQVPGRLTCICGTADPLIPESDQQQIAAALLAQDPLGARMRYLAMPGADHGFMGEAGSSFHPVSAELGWEVLLKSLA